MSNSAPTQEEAPKKKKKGLGMLLVVVGLVLGLGGGGGGAYWFYFVRTPAKAAAPPPPKTSMMAMDPFVVNLADEGGGRFLRVTLSLVVEGEKEPKGEGKEGGGDAVATARLRSAILERLAQQKAEHLVTPEGKAELKKVIAEQAEHANHELKVADVLFSEFVVQF